ncbi:MAG: helix-turn-helix transcriptional regulator [Ruminococcaceae bacterium]|nr:helix-turn-helix transcriptional regulator [Oscillospiraceae bacterium]
MNEKSSCPVEATLGLIGGKYKTLILWHLAEAKMRYSQLQKAIPKVTPKILTQQLRELESEGLIHREVFPVVPPKVEYSLTKLGKSLMPVLIAMRDWGTNYLRTHKEIEPGCFMVHSNLNQNF